MTALLIIIVAIVLLLIGYVGYGSWLAKQWGIDPTRKTPAIEKEDGVDYMGSAAGRSDGTSLFIHRRCRPDQRTDSGIYLRMGSRILMVYYRRYLFRRSAGFWIPVRFDPS